MSILTPQQLNKIQGGIDAVRDKINLLPITSTSPNSTVLGQNVSQPLSAEQIKPQSQLQINELSGEKPELSLAFSDIAGMKTGNDIMAKKIVEDQKRLEASQKESTSLWDKLAGSKTSAEVASDTASQLGYDPAQYLAQRQTDIAEMESLQKQYQDMIGMSDNERLNIENNPSFSKEFANKEWTYAEKKWNSRLNTLAGAINTKASIMKLKDENYTQATQYIQQAVNNYTADLKTQYDQYDKFRQDNKDLFNELGDDYVKVYDTAERFALQEYQDKRNEKTQIGNLMAEYPDAPWTANSLSLSLGEASQIAQQSQKYQLELQSQKADIYSKTKGNELDDLYKTLQIEKMRNELIAQENDFESGVLNDKEMKSIDTTPESQSIRSLTDLKTKAENYKKIVDDEGFAVKGAGKILLDSAYADLQIAWKEAAKLGALTGPDMKLIENAVKPTTSWGGIWNKFTAGKNAVISGINQTINTINQKGKKNSDMLLSRNPKYKGSEYIKQLVNPFYQEIEIIDPNGNEGTIPEYQLEDALKQGYKKK
jgi:hypothetical protein